jgi:hypothetical protein
METNSAASQLESPRSNSESSIAREKTVRSEDDNDDDWIVMWIFASSLSLDATVCVNECEYEFDRWNWILILSASLVVVWLIRNEIYDDELEGKGILRSKYGENFMMSQ